MLPFVQVHYTKMLKRIKSIDKDYLIIAGIWLVSEVGNFTTLSYVAGAFIASYLIYKVFDNARR